MVLLQVFAHLQSVTLLPGCQASRPLMTNNNHTMKAQGQLGNLGVPLNRAITMNAHSEKI